MEKQRKNELITMFVYLIGSIGVGYLSYRISDVMISFAAAIIGFIIIAEILKKILKSQEKYKWFLSNGGMIYFFMWVIVWTILINL